MSSVRHIHLPTTSQIAMIQQRVNSALQRWGADWVSDWTADGAFLRDLRVVAVNDELEQPLPDRWVELGGLWIGRGRGSVARFSNAILGRELSRPSDYPDDWIAEVIEAAWMSQARALCAALYGRTVEQADTTECPAPPAAAFEVGSGAVIIVCENLGLHVLAGKEIWHSLAPPDRSGVPNLPRLTSLEVASRRAEARLEVVLGSVEVDLTHLMDLRCGDVLHLQSRLDEPVTVLCEGKPFARGALGAAGGRKCVELRDPF